MIVHHMRDTVVFANRRIEGGYTEDAFVCVTTEGGFDKRHLAMLEAFLAREADRLRSKPVPKPPPWEPQEPPPRLQDIVRV